MLNFILLMAHSNFNGLSSLRRRSKTKMCSTIIFSAAGPFLSRMHFNELNGFQAEFYFDCRSLLSDHFSQYAVIRNRSLLSSSCCVKLDETSLTMARMIFHPEDNFVVLNFCSEKRDFNFVFQQINCDEKNSRTERNSTPIIIVLTLNKNDLMSALSGRLLELVPIFPRHEGFTIIFLRRFRLTMNESEALTLSFSYVLWLNTSKQSSR